MTKAKRIYLSTKLTVRRYLENNEYVTGMRLVNMTLEKDDILYTRTINAIAKEIHNDMIYTNDDFRYNFITKEEWEKELNIIYMVKNTLENLNK